MSEDRNVIPGEVWVMVHKDELDYLRARDKELDIATQANFELHKENEGMVQILNNLVCSGSHTESPEEFGKQALIVIKEQSVPVPEQLELIRQWLRDGGQ